ncbi:hypothetical protein X946_4615 [Burkholderia sp. ABCPW 111]|nr:hypothetical protein X946_4615 [Burkholderia sp. ABCPW 111]
MRIKAAGETSLLHWDQFNSTERQLICRLDRLSAISAIPT